jgi:hypothetical protein
MVTVRSWTTCWSIGSVHDGAVLDGLLLLNNFALIVVCGVIESSKPFSVSLATHFVLETYVY